MTIEPIKGWAIVIFGDGRPEELLRPGFNPGQVVRLFRSQELAEECIADMKSAPKQHRLWEYRPVRVEIREVER